MIRPACKSAWLSFGLAAPLSLVSDSIEFGIRGWMVILRLAKLQLRLEGETAGSCWKVMSNRTAQDILIIGAGPAGSAAATVLAERGHRVVVLEREKFPRYHIGESLLPFSFQPLQRLGLIERMKQSHFQKKYSVVFVQPNGKASQPF